MMAASSFPVQFHSLDFYQTFKPIHIVCVTNDLTLNFHLIPSMHLLTNPPLPCICTSGSGTAYVTISSPVYVPLFHFPFLSLSLSLHLSHLQSLASLLLQGWQNAAEKLFKTKGSWARPPSPFNPS